MEAPIEDFRKSLVKSYGGAASAETSEGHPSVGDSHTSHVPVIQGVLADLELLAVGFFDGTAALTATTESSICADSLKKSVIGGFDLLDYHKFYLPNEFIKVTMAYQVWSKNLNLSYSYCDFVGWFINFANLIGGFGITWFFDLF